MRGVIKRTGYISNENPQELLDECSQTFKKGNNLIVFPEGTRTEPNSRLKFKRGAANIALRCRVPVTTVLIKMTPATLTKGAPWYKVAPTQAHFFMQLATHPFNKEMALACQSISMLPIELFLLGIFGGAGILRFRVF